MLYVFLQHNRLVYFDFKFCIGEFLGHMGAVTNLEKEVREIIVIKELIEVRIVEFLNEIIEVSGTNGNHTVLTLYWTLFHFVLKIIEIN